MVFGTARDVSGLGNTRGEIATSRYRMGAWAAFARGSKAGLNNYGWSGYSSNGKLHDGNHTKSDPQCIADTMIIELGYNNSALPSQERSASRPRSILAWFGCARHVFTPPCRTKGDYPLIL
jgi:hypothetical protein